MICLNNTDVIEGGASIASVVDYQIHGLVGTAFTQLAAGTLSDTLTTALYTAGAAISVVSIILANTHDAAVNVTLCLDPANSGSPRHLIPKTISLGVGYSLHTDGARITVLDADGRLLKGYGAHAFTHQDAGADKINVDGLSGVLADLQKPTIQQGLASARPTAGVAGRLYYSTNTKVLERDNGTTWDEIARGETVIRLAQLSEKAHGSLSGVTADQHHSQSHNAASHSDITSSGANIEDAVTKKHTQGTDITLGTLDTKNPPIDADKVIYRNSASSDALVTSTWAQVKTFLFAKLNPSIYNCDIKWLLKTPYTTAANRYTIQSPNKLAIDVGGAIYFIESKTDIDLSAAANWDDVVTTNWTVASNRAGKDFYIYACQPASGDIVKIVLSANSSVPSGYTADNSRKMGGFHCLCVSAGTISGHTLTGFVAGDVLPASIWDLNHRPVSNPEGMVYDEKSSIWVDIYLTSGTGASTASVYGGTISNNRNWLDFVDDGGAVSKRMLKDREFQLIAAGSNEETNISGSTAPGTTGGHSDTANRRMISNIGCEDCAGAMWQWLDEQSYRSDGTAWAWYDLPGAKGSLYRQGTYGDVKLVAGGGWADAADCGSRGRVANNCRWVANASIGGRGRSQLTKTGNDVF
jgi:hypothetical protein